MLSDFPLSERSNFFVFCVSRGEGAVFLLCFLPLQYSREGNFGLHSTRFNYSSFYGIFITKVWGGWMVKGCGCATARLPGALQYTEPHTIFRVTLTLHGVAG